MLDYTAEAVKTINEKVNELLVNHDDLTRNPTIDPSVDIMKIAQACGVKKVMFVSPDQLEGKHAIVVDGVVKIDKNDAHGQQLFDLAHEVGHIVFEQYAMVIEFKITLQEIGNNKSFVLTTSRECKAARQGTSKKSELSSEDREIENFLDRFAANLLVPIHRFQLWEDKSDKEIAEAFKVEESCITKRRNEIEYEGSILSAAMKPCSIEDIVDPSVKLDIDNLLAKANK